MRRSSRYLGSVAGFGAVCLAWHASPFSSHKDLVGDRAEQWVVGDVSSEAAGPTVVNLIGKCARLELRGR